MANWPLIMPGFRRKPPFSCLLIICQPSGWHNYPEVCEAVRPKQTEGCTVAKCRNGLRPWPSAIPHFAHRPVTRRSIPKEGCSFGVTSGAVRRCADWCAVDAPQEAHLWAQRRGQEAALFLFSGMADAMPGAADRAFL